MQSSFVKKNVQLETYVGQEDISRASHVFDSEHRDRLLLFSPSVLLIQARCTQNPIPNRGGERAGHFRPKVPKVIASKTT